jgi:hypothetical protein
MKTRLPFVSVAFFVILNVLITGCHIASRESAAPIESTYFVNGDPIAFVKDTALDNNSFLNESNIDKIDGFRLSSMVNFKNRSEKEGTNHKSIEDAKKHNKAAETDTTKNNSINFSVKVFKNESNQKYYKYISESLKIELYFMPQLNKGNVVYELKKFKAANQEHDLETIHYSVNKDFTAFSFLVYGSDSDEKELVELIFLKDQNKNVQYQNADSKYKFMFGPGVKISWNQNEEHTLNLCGTDSVRFQDQLLQGLNEWTQYLKIV